MVKSILPLTLTKTVAKIGGKTLVGPVDLTINPKGFTIVMGPNGSGKTTLLRLMHGLQRVGAGQVSWNVPEEAAQCKQAYVFQTPIMMRRTVVDSIAFPLVLRGVKKTKARQQAAEWATRFGLGDALQRSAPVLSGGEKQKLSLARALISKPDILFLDEPCANLDGRVTREIEIILQETQQAGTRIVMATHDMGQAKRLASDVIFMLKGSVHEAATAKDFFNGPQTREAQGFLIGDIVD